MQRDIPGLRIRAATCEDAGELNAMIGELAEFEHLAQVNHSTAESLAAEFCRPDCILNGVIAEFDGQAVGMASWFQTYSTFAAHRGMYVEDIYVRPAWRHRGIGAAILRYLARVAKERDYRRLEWLSLLWNTDALEFYESVGAHPSDAWTVFRLTGESLDRLANA